MLAVFSRSFLFFFLYIFPCEGSWEKKHEDTVKTTSALHERPTPGVPSGQERLFPLARPLGARRTNCGGTEETSDLTARGVIARSGTQRSLTQWIMNGEVAERASLNTNYPARFIGSHKHARTDSTYSGSLVVDTGWRIDWAVCVRSRKLIALPYRRAAFPTIPLLTRVDADWRSESVFVKRSLRAGNSNDFPGSGSAACGKLYDYERAWTRDTETSPVNLDTRLFTSNVKGMTVSIISGKRLKFVFISSTRLNCRVRPRAMPYYLKQGQIKRESLQVLTE